MNENIPAPQVWPTLRAKDAYALIAFLVEAFGFEEVAVHGDGTSVAHAELAWPLGGGIMMGSGKEGPRDVFPLKPGTFGAYVVCDDTDALFERAVKAGATVVEEPNDKNYGSRDCIVRDPEGNYWSFGTYRGEGRKA